MAIDEVIEQAQEFMSSKGIEGWLLYDYRGMNPIFWDTLGPVAHVTRPCWFWIPATGEPQLIVSFVDQGRFEHLGISTTLFVNRADMMAALTNRHGGERPVPPGVRSRGGIVMELLGQDGPAQAAAWLEALDVAAYRPFNVLFGDPEQFYFFASEAHEPPRALAPGCYALSNSTLDDRSWPKVERSLAFFADHRGQPGEQLMQDLQYFLGDATPPDAIQSEDPGEEIHGALGAVFIRAPGYGTVSSTILTSGGTLGERYYFAEGKRLGENPAGAFRLVQFD